MYYKQERLPSSRQMDDLDGLLNDIARGLRQEKLDYPITVMYCELEIMSYAYRYMEEALQEEQYVGEPGVPENRLFAMYHQAYTDKMKTHITCQLAKKASRVRFVIATVALGMGLDAPSIRKIIHFKSPTSIERYLQETGRAGRDGQPSDVTMYFNKTDLRSNRPGQQPAMVAYCKSDSQCLRQMLMEYLGFSAPPERVLCRCCQYCKDKCDCDSCLATLVANMP